MTVDDALETLFAGPVETFIAERDRLAKELKAQGDKAGAERVKAAHKPTVTAHALNLLVRQERALVVELLALGKALAAGGADFHAALAQQRALIQTLTKKAAALAGSDAPALVAVVQGAMASAELAEQLMQARFSKLPEVPVGFFGSPGAALAAEDKTPFLKIVPRPPEPEPEPQRDLKHEAAVAAAEKAADAARAEADAKGREADALEKAARDASNAAAAAKTAHVKAVQRAKELAEEARKLRLSR